MNPNAVAIRGTETPAVIANKIFKVIAVDVVLFDDDCARL
jgi:hypothetical protein